MQDTLSFFMFLLQVKDKNEETKQVQGRKQKTPCLNTHQCLWSFSVMPLYNRASGSASYITHYAHTHFYSVMWQSHSKCYRNVTSKLKPKLFPPSMLPERQTYCTELYIYISLLSFYLHCGNLAPFSFAPPHCMPRMQAQNCEAWSDLGPHIAPVHISISHYWL